MSDEEICFFHTSWGACSILDVGVCDGNRKYCTFRKSKTEFYADRDKAVKSCREKNLCSFCKYVAKPCSLTLEIDDLNM